MRHIPEELIDALRTLQEEYKISIPCGDPEKYVNAVIEIQEGTKNKTEAILEDLLSFFRLSRRIWKKYPADYGYIPKTLGEDGDRLDILLVRIRNYTFLQLILRNLVKFLLKLLEEKLDINIIVNDPILPNTIVEAYVLGIIYMTDNGDPDHKVVACVKEDFSTGRKVPDNLDMTDVPRHVLYKITHFFETYKIPEKKKVTVDGYGNREEAIKVIKEAQERYEEEKRLKKLEKEVEEVLAN